MPEENAPQAVLVEKLLAAREKRVRPGRDDKVLTSWNGEMIAGFAMAGRLLEEPKYTETAVKAANFILTTLRTKDGRLLIPTGPSKKR